MLLRCFFFKKSKSRKPEILERKVNQKRPVFISSRKEVATELYSPHSFPAHSDYIRMSRIDERTCAPTQSATNGLFESLPAKPTFNKKKRSVYIIENSFLGDLCNLPRTDAPLAS